MEVLIGLFAIPSALTLGIIGFNNEKRDKTRFKIFIDKLIEEKRKNIELKDDDLFVENRHIYAIISEKYFSKKPSLRPLNRDLKTVNKLYDVDSIFNSCKSYAKSRYLNQVKFNSNEAELFESLHIDDKNIITYKEHKDFEKSQYKNIFGKKINIHLLYKIIFWLFIYFCFYNSLNISVYK